MIVSASDRSRESSPENRDTRDSPVFLRLPDTPEDALVLAGEIRARAFPVLSDANLSKVEEGITFLERVGRGELPSYLRSNNGNREVDYGVRRIARMVLGSLQGVRILEEDEIGSRAHFLR